MTASDYFLGLLAIISGLAASHMVGGLHLLLFHRHRVRWDWLAVVAMLFVGYELFYSWWISWSSLHPAPDRLPFWYFLLAVGQLSCIVLSARAIMPALEPGTNVDLNEHYGRASRYLWTAQTILSVLFLISTTGKHHFLAGNTASAMRLGAAGVETQIVLFGMLALLRSRLVHAIIVPVLLVTAIALSINVPL